MNTVAGWKGAARGIKRSATRAGSAWGERAFVSLLEYMDETKATRFIAPHVRAWAERRGLPKPPSNYAWGGVFRRASQNGWIAEDGFDVYGDAVMHTQTVRAWKSA